MPVTSKTKVKLYPYTIPPVKCPSDDVIKHLDAWYVLEFLRIEALLRSQTVHTMWKQGKGSEESSVKLFKKYGFTWSVLKGSHHRFLELRREETRGWYSPNRPIGPASKLWEKAGIIDMNENARMQPETVDIWGKRLLIDNPRYLHIQIDTAYKPGTIIKELRPILAERHEKVYDKAGHKIPTTAQIGDRFLVSTSAFGFFQPSHPTKKPPIQDLKTWLDYLTCYDLRSCQRLSYSVIAKRVYPTLLKKPRRQAEIAVYRVNRLIFSAENRIWPPKT